MFIVLCTSCNAQNKKSNQIIVNGTELVLISNDYEFTEGPAADKKGMFFLPTNRMTEFYNGMQKPI
ncbi:hypothetical protein EV196_11187 [Mariniflexile fucanivorans]|uniref:Uncharacterized protein n=1 Tax=Mariniflexile fucanivorans TaxID=264023 RepID=A0A4R1RAV7_9FLAO|nr:hypothetical protein [Mariniflexile fucanivorans]TCL62891.1 hypothetical protein EV196_11187 [Mariniflexile fucanivorans]